MPAVTQCLLWYLAAVNVVSFTVYGIDKRKGACILDMFSCLVQGVIPYGAQMLMAAGLAAISPASIIGYLYYPMTMGLFALLSILFRFPRKYS